jgi:hypothetical protein
VSTSQHLLTSYLLFSAAICVVGLGHSHIQPGQIPRQQLGRGCRSSRPVGGSHLRPGAAVRHGRQRGSVTLAGQYHNGFVTTRPVHCTA